MLTKTNDSKLEKYQQVDKKHIFFYQRWREMLENRTLDMYQYNILNSHVACKELYDVIEKTLAGHLISRQNIDDCKSESLAIVKEDAILDRKNRALKMMLIRILSSKISKKSSEGLAEDKNDQFYVSLKRLKEQLKMPIRQLENFYLSYILDSLKESIDEQNYNRIEKDSNCLISQCINRGWSNKGLFQLSDCFTGNMSRNDKWECFKKHLLNDICEFEVYYSIKIETLQGLPANSIREIVRTLGIQTELGEYYISISANRPNLCSKLSPQTTYLKVDIKAPDRYAGALSASNYINSKLSIAAFYNIISPLIANSPDIIVYDLSSRTVESLKLTDIFKTYDYIDSHNSIFEDTNIIFKDTNKGEISRKIGATFAYTSLSRSALFQETKYISLWIALEALMKTGLYSDIISHIKQVLPEVMCRKYVYRIMRNFSEDCLRCGFYADQEIGIDMRAQDKIELVSNLISVFRNDSKYQILEKKCEHNTLLLYRCKEIHTILNNTEEIIRKLEHYTQKIRWHIQRLYRIRNEITHSAFKQNISLIIYIEHLYSYLAQVMAEIIYYIEHKGAVSVEDGLACIRETHLTYMEILNSGTLPLEEILPNGIIELIE